MTRLLHHSAAICAALFITVLSIGAIVTVPPAGAAIAATPVLA